MTVQFELEALELLDCAYFISQEHHILDPLAKAAIDQGLLRCVNPEQWITSEFRDYYVAGEFHQVTLGFELC